MRSKAGYVRRSINLITSSLTPGAWGRVGEKTTSAIAGMRDAISLQSLQISKPLFLMNNVMSINVKLRRNGQIP